jgi:hypothetical protein
MGKKNSSSSIWRRVPTEKLILEQGVAPVMDLTELDKLWPVDDDPDALLRFILSERARRRGLSRRKKKTA